MFEAQHFLEEQESENFGDPKSWLLGEDHNSSPTHRRIQSSLGNSTTTASAGPGSSLDRVLYQDLVEIVPLVQSLIDRKSSSSFTRRASMIYTKTPSRESLSKKVTGPKGRNAAQSIPTKKRRDPGEKDQGKGTGNNLDADSFSVFSSRAAEKDREELVMLKEQVEELRMKLSEKDELLKSVEISKNQVNAVQAKLDELRHQASEKDSLIKSMQLQLSDAKIKLADKQAMLEKLQWEAMTSNGKAEKLQQELECMQGEISSFMLLFDGLTKSDSTVYADDYDISAKHLEHLPCIDDLDETELQRMDEARKAYIAAVATAKEKQDEESITAAARARICLQSLVLKA